MNEEKKAIKWLKEKTLDMNIDSESLHYLILLKYLIKNQGKEIERLKQRLKTSNDTCKYLRNTIDKAIEYIEQSKTYPYLEKYYVRHLEKILKGENKQ